MWMRIYFVEMCLISNFLRAIKIFLWAWGINFYLISSVKPWNYTQISYYWTGNRVIHVYVFKLTENVINFFQWDFTKLRTIKWLWRFSIDRKSNLWMWLEKSDVKFRIWNCSDILISSSYIKYVLDFHYKRRVMYISHQLLTKSHFGEWITDY